jgi:hypothetical protein
MSEQKATVMNIEPFASRRSGYGQLTAALGPILQLLEERAAALSKRFEAETLNSFSGYGITPQEAVEYLQTAKLEIEGDSNVRFWPERIRQEHITAFLAVITYFPFEQLRQLFRLSRFEQLVILTCLLPEVFRGFNRVFGFLQDDATMIYPSLGFLLDLYCPDPEERALARQSFHSGGVLRSWRLIVSLGDEGRTPQLLRCYRPDERIAAYLLGDNQYDGNLEGLVLLQDPLEPAPLKAKNEHILENIISGVHAGRECILVHLSGDDDEGAALLVNASAGRLGWRLLKTTLPSLIHQKEWRLERIELLLREALLQPAVILINEQGLNREAVPERGALLQCLARKGILIFYRGHNSLDVEGLEPGLHYLKLEFKLPRPAERLSYWQEAIAEHQPSWPPEAAEQLAMRYPFSSRQVNKMFERLRLRMNGDGHEPGEMLNIFQQVINDYTRQPLDELAQRIEAMSDWQDLVLPAALVEHLRAFRNMIAHQFVVYEKWGLGAKEPRRRGVVALLSGPSGTGKTMAAEVIAHDLGINLYRVDLAGIVSKYIGETEKNLKKIFESARGTNTLLFFDEADSLFGRRTEIHDSHDRYANLEVNYLLQRLEEHDGPVILASNRRKNIDEAFLRRIHFVIEFPLPSENLRQLIWQKKLPPTLPRNPDVDISLLSRQFELSGGDIKNAALKAAFMAAEEGCELNMEHLLAALRREYLKLGKHYPGAQLQTVYQGILDSPDDRRRKKEVQRLGT